MRITIATLMLLLFSIAAVAQTPPPVNVRATVDASGEAMLQWMAPFNADYMDDFEDGSAQDWNFGYGDWSVQDGNLHVGFFGGIWASAYYAGETVSEGIYETEFARQGFSAHYANSMVLFDAQADPGAATDGYVFSVTPGNDVGEFEGSYYIARILDGTSYELQGWIHNPIINNGLGVYNVMSVAYEDNAVTFYINGVEVFTYWDQDVPLSGVFGLAAAEQGGTFPDYGIVDWEYVAYDSNDAALASRPVTGFELPDLASILPEEAMQAPENLQAPAGYQQDTPMATGGFFDEASGTREIDEFINYRIYRNGELTGTSTTESYSEMLPDFGRYDYIVTADYDEGESTADSGMVVYKDPDGIVIQEDFNNGFPAGWSIDSDHPNDTWHIDEGGEVGLFDTPYMLANDANGLDYEERLVTPEFNVDGAELVTVDFDQWFFDNEFEFGWLQYKLDDGEWDYVRGWADTMPDTLHTFWDLTGLFAGAQTAQIGFLYDDFIEDFNGLYWGIDNVEVYVQGDGQADAVTLTLTPQNTVFPPSGGTLFYDASLVSTLPNSYAGVQFWDMVTTPGGNEMGPLTTIPFTLQPFMDITVVDMWLTVPGNAPAGVYTYTGYVGYMNGPFIMDSFTFEKTGAVAGAEPWNSGGDWIAADATGETVATPNAFELGEAYPNPFNPSTTITVALPEAAELSLAVYSIQGRQVAELAGGPVSAGTHTFTFDASSLASGVYFIQAAVPGELNQVRKVTLMK